MKKYFFLAVCIGAAASGWAQAVPYPQGDRAADAVQEAPASSIDLLRRSLGSSDVASAADQNAVSTRTAPTTSTVSAPAAASTGAVSGLQKRPSPATAANTRPASGNFLEMPLSSGAVVTTTVPQRAPAASAQRRTTRARRTAVAPASASASAARTATAASTQTAVSTAPASVVSSSSSTISGEPSDPIPGTAADMEQASREAIAQEELDFAARMLQQAREEMSSGRYIPPSAAETAGSVPSVQANRPFDPNDYRPGVEWQPSNTTHFTIYTQKRDSGISSSNMGMIFESAYTTLRRNIPWMMSDKVRVFVYQDHNSYLKHEPNAKAWTRALAYPTRGEIVVYDEPGKQQELKEVFTHELVHIFTQKYFDKHHTGRLMTPEWLDEGLAVYMEDQAYNGRQGGPWANDFKTLNFQRSKETQLANFSSTNMFGGARSFTTGQRGGGEPLYFMAFDQFMQDGSLASMEGRGKTQDWYFQAYAMVRFLLNPSGGMSPSNRMQFEQFTRLIAQGEQVRDPRSGFPARDANGRPVYKPYPVESALGRAYRYNSTANFEDAFWRWADGAR